jgi:hypothetical protein
MPNPGCHAVLGLPSSVVDAVALRSPGSLPEEYAVMSPPAPAVERPTRSSTSSSGMSADRLALPARVNERAVGSVNCREMIVSGSSRGGYC